MVKTILGIDHIYHSFIDRLYNHYAAVEICLFIHIGNYPINKTSQEISFTKLNDAFRTNNLDGCLFI